LIALFRQYYALYTLSLLSAVFLLAITFGILLPGEDTGTGLVRVTATATPTQILTTATESPLTPVPTSTLSPTPVPTLEATSVPSPEPTAAPAPVATLAPAPIVQPAAGSLEALICSFSWPCGEAIAVASCESGTDAAGNLDGTWASNGTSYGLMQLAPAYHPDWTDFWNDPDGSGVPNWARAEYNVAHAYGLWVQSGTWQHWSCRP
jgi:hypothetical protein